MSRNESEVLKATDWRAQLPMSEELVALLRHRVATRYYDQPRVIDAVSRAVILADASEPR